MFADRVGISIRNQRPATEDERHDEVREAATGLVVAAVPISFFLLAVAGVLGLQRAFNLSQLAGFGVLALYSYVASRASGSTRLRAIVGAVGLTVVGIGLILLMSATK